MRSVLCCSLQVTAIPACKQTSDSSLQLHCALALTFQAVPSELCGVCLCRVLEGNRGSGVHFLAQ